ncbi:TPA: hypothetical protein ACQW8P_001799, partial [Streptococcus pneumoniae]
EHQKRKDEFCPFSSLADFNPLQLTKSQKTDFYRSEYQKRKDKICPFSSLAFFQPTTVDKEPLFIIQKLD